MQGLEEIKVAGYPGRLTRKPSENCHLKKTVIQEPKAPFYLLNEADWKVLLSRSKSQPVIVFKHSMSCGISCDALNTFKDFISKNRSIEYGIVDVVENRPLSNKIASDIGITHESPQVIRIDHGQAVWHTSHWSITTDKLEKGILS